MDISFGQTQPQNLITVRDWIRWCSSHFSQNKLYFGHGTDNAWDESVALVLWAISQPWDRLEWILEARLDPSEQRKIFESAKIRVNERMPLPYIIGEAWFAGLQFEVSSDVLIPRSPIAELVANQFSPFLTQYPSNILDLCTGSGCIGILCALAFEDAHIDMSDLSGEAIAVAEKNVKRHDLEQRVAVIQSDLFANLHKKYDIIVSNPPYVDAQDMSSLPLEYHHEPKLALESGDDGLDITRKIIAQASHYLNDGGFLVCEVGNSFEALESSMPNVGFYWPELENGGHGIFILTKTQLESL